MGEDRCEITCIVCPWGCQVKFKVKEGEIKNIEGNKCRRGIGYVRQEFYNPKRVLTTTVKLKGSRFPLLPVRTNKPIPKKMLGKCMQYLTNIEVKAPIKLGEVIVPNILGTRTNIISTRNLDSD
jgi:CxxC motif-containing protein